MKSTQDLYISVLKEEITPNDFLFQVRKDPRFKQWITPLQTYEDTIQTLKNKGAINENIFMDDEEDMEQKPKPPYGPNVAWDAMQRLDKGEGDDIDDAFLKAFTGTKDDAVFDPRMSFSINEDIDDYGKAYNSIIEKLQQGSGNDAQEVSHMIDVATAEYDLSDEERQTLEVDVFDWRNQESGTVYDDEELEEDTLEGGLGDDADLESFNRRELEAGINTEMEHTDDPTVATEIASDHMTEDPRYYSKLKKANLKEWANPLHPLDLNKSFPQFDSIRLNQLLKGARYEYEQSGKKDWLKSYEKAGNNLLKDALYYVYKLNNIKKDRKKNKEVEVKKQFVDKSNAVKTVKKVSTKQSRLRSGEKIKVVKKQSVTTLTQKPKRAKGIKQVMSIPGKEKKVKTLNESKLNIIAKLIKEEVEKILKKKAINEDHLNDKQSQIQYILQHKEYIKQQDQITPEYLESLTDNYIAKLYQKLEDKVKENQSLGDQQPEFSELQEAEDDLLTEDEVKLQEVKGTEIKAGETFDMQGDLGKFKKGEKVTVKAVNPFGDEIQFTLRNETGVEDTFIMDVNDKFEDEPVNEEKEKEHKCSCQK